MQNINEIEELIKLISKLPGLGPKSAKRIVLKLINNRDELVKPLASTLNQVYKNVTRCNFCGSLKSNLRGCINCESSKEKYNKICVVEDIADQWSIENSNIFHEKYLNFQLTIGLQYLLPHKFCYIFLLNFRN